MFLGSRIRVWGFAVLGFGFRVRGGVRGSGFSSFRLGVRRFAVSSFEVGVSRLGVSGLVFRGSGFGFGVSRWRFWVSHLGFAVFKVTRLRIGVFEVRGFRCVVSEFRVFHGPGFQVRGSGLGMGVRVFPGSGFRIRCFEAQGFGAGVWTIGFSRGVSG